MKRTPSLVAPAVLLPIAAILALARSLPDSVATAVDAAPLLVFGAGALLGIVTQRGRLVIGVVVLALADCALVNVGSRPMIDTVALLLPVNLAAVVWLGEKTPLAGRGALLFGVTVVQAAIVAMLQLPRLAPVASVLEQPILESNLGSWTALPQPAVFAFAAALGLVVARFVLHGHALAAGAGWALVASFLALDGASTGAPASVHLATAGLLLVVGATWEPRYVARPDDVTGLPPLYEFNRALRRLPRRYVLAVVEIDDFSKFRQEHGPESARRIRRRVARILARVRGGGCAFYCERPMFAVIFPYTSARMAVRYLDIVRRKVELATVDLSLPVQRRPDQRSPVAIVERTVSVTISAGVAQCNTRGTDPRTILHAAEDALERARHDGMDRVSV